MCNQASLYNLSNASFFTFEKNEYDLWTNDLDIIHHFSPS